VHSVVEAKLNVRTSQRSLKRSCLKLRLLATVESEMLCVPGRLLSLKNVVQANMMDLGGSIFWV
jgi:hypothetical protein